MRRPLARRYVRPRENPVEVGASGALLALGAAIGVGLIGFLVGKKAGEKAQRAKQVAQAGNPSLNFSVPVQPNTLTIEPIVGTNPSIQINMGTNLIISCPGPTQDFSATDDTVLKLAPYQSGRPVEVAEFMTVTEGGTIVTGSWTTSAGVIQSMMMQVTVIPEP